MVVFKPFSGIRFSQSPTLGAQLAPPYDVISADEQQVLYRQHPHNIVRIDYGRSDPHTPPTNTVYTRAHAYFSEWLRSGVLQRDQAAAYYVYRHTYPLPDGTQKSLTGVMGALQLHPFEARQVIPHENTMPGPIQDRLSLTHHCHANLSPIYTLIDDPDHELDRCLARLTQPAPDMHANTAGGTYELWVIQSPHDTQAIMHIIQPRPVVIADGHHRYTTALHYQAWARQQQGVTDPESDYTLAFVAAAQNEGITIYPTHRGVYQTAFFESPNWLHALQSVFEIETHPSIDTFLSQPYPMGTMALMRPNSQCVWVLHPPAPEKVAHYFPLGTSLALQGLDVALLQHVIFIGMLDMTLDSIAAKERIRYYKAMSDLQADLTGGHIQAAFVMQPPPLSTLTTICIQGEKMPQKSTYFYPKLITGLVMNPVDPFQPSHSVGDHT